MLCKAATSEHLGDARRNDPTVGLIRLYERWGKGGYDVIITGNVMVDREALEAPRNVVLDAETDGTLLKKWATAAKGGGAIVLVQLSHPGRQSPLAASWARPVAPGGTGLKLSGVGIQLHRTPRVMTDPLPIVAAFQRAAQRAKDAGFDGVQIHAAHGYLLSQWLGTRKIQGARLLVRIVDAVKRDNFILSVKLNVADHGTGLVDETDCLRVLDLLDDHGAVDLVELSDGGTYATGMRCLGDDVDFPESPMIRVLDRFLRRKPRRIRLIVTGDLLTGGAADALLNRFPSLIIGVARAACVDPDIGHHWRQSRRSPPPHVLPRPPPFLWQTTSLLLPTALRRLFIPGLRFGWYQRQLWRLAAGSDPLPTQGHLAYLFFVLPRALLFEPSRLFAAPGTWRTSLLAWTSLLLLLLSSSSSKTIRRS